jgi:peptide/nickel transport system permease protein
MYKYLIQRILSTIPVLLVVSIVIFTVVRITPGDPAQMILGDTATEAQIEALRVRMGLKDSILVQYKNWMVKIFHGDLGFSIRSGDIPVTTLLASYLKPTMSLTVFSMIISVSIALSLGILSARKEGTLIDKSITTMMLVGISIPGFLFGLGLMLVFAVQFRWFSVAGYKPLSAGFWTHLHTLTLPAISLGLMHSAMMLRMTRGSVLDAMNSDFMILAKAKGVGELPL